MGGSPYPGLPMEDLFEYLQDGKRMAQPATSPDELYEIMLQCWQENTYERPDFHDLVSQLERILESKAVVCYDSLNQTDLIRVRWLVIFRGDDTMSPERFYVLSLCICGINPTLAMCSVLGASFYLKRLYVHGVF